MKPVRVLAAQKGRGRDVLWDHGEHSTAIASSCIYTYTSLAIQFKPTSLTLIWRGTSAFFHRTKDKTTNKQKKNKEEKEKRFQGRIVAFAASAKKKKKEEEEHIKYAQVTFHSQKEKQVPIIIVALCSRHNNEKKKNSCIHSFFFFSRVRCSYPICSWSLSRARACNELRRKKK